MEAAAGREAAGETLQRGRKGKRANKESTRSLSGHTRSLSRNAKHFVSKRH